MALEGKELEGKIGNVGTYFVDADDKGNIEIGVSVKVDLIAELQKLAEKSGKAWLKAGADGLAKLLGR